MIKKDGSRNLLHLRHKAATLAVFLEISVLEKEKKNPKNACNGS